MNEYTEPTEQGYYLDREGDLWRLVAGQWVFPESDAFAGKHERYAPFTRLMTEGEWETKRGASILPLSPKLGGGTYTSLSGQRYTIMNSPMVSAS